MDETLEEAKQTTTTDGIQASDELPTTGIASETQDDLIMDDLLVEEVSIDGMCGVY